MTSLVVTVVVILAIAVCVMLYAAFPDRGRLVPHAPWLGDLLALPVTWLHRLARRQG